MRYRSLLSLAGAVLLSGCPTPNPSTDGGDASSTDVPATDGTTNDVRPGDASQDASDDVSDDVSTDAPALCPTVGTPITLPMSSIDGTLSGPSRLNALRCDPTTAGPDATHMLTLTQPTNLLISTAGARTNIETVVSVLRSCSDATTSVACSNDKGPIFGRGVYRGEIPAGSYYVVVDQVGETSSPPGGGSYNLLVRQINKAANAECATPTSTRCSPQCPT